MRLLKAGPQTARQQRTRSTWASTRHRPASRRTCMSGVMPSSLSAELTSRACSEYSAASVLTVSLWGEELRPMMGPAAAAAGGSGGAACCCTKRPSARGISILSGELPEAASRGLTGLGVPCIGSNPRGRLPRAPATGGRRLGAALGAQLMLADANNPANAGPGQLRPLVSSGLGARGLWAGQEVLHCN